MSGMWLDKGEIFLFLNCGYTILEAQNPDPLPCRLQPWSSIRPPPISSFSQHYPGNDERYQKYLGDVRYSFRESMIRSIERGEVKLQRKLPKSESLKDCMDRTIPYFVERIVPDAVNQGKRVLISSSENAIRGLLMHLCEIPESDIL